MFGHRVSGAYMHKFAWTKIIRHQLVRSGASPDDPALAECWAWRRRKALPISKTSQWLRKAQDGRCPICRGALFAADRPQSPREWEQWPIANRTTIVEIATRDDGMPDEAEPRLIHADCLNRGSSPALLPAYEPTGLA